MKKGKGKQRAEEIHNDVGSGERGEGMRRA